MVRNEISLLVKELILASFKKHSGSEAVQAIKQRRRKQADRIQLPLFQTCSKSLPLSSKMGAMEGTETLEKLTQKTFSYWKMLLFHQNMEFVQGHAIFNAIAYKEITKIF